MAWSCIQCFFLCIISVVVISDEEKEKKCYKVFSCAAGFSKPQIDTPMAYAYGDVPEGTEYIIKVNGDSMEPEIPDGAYVPIKIDREYLNNKIGIFYYDGNSICKKYTKGKDNIVRLISINKKYEPIEIKEYTQLECNGKVICGKDKKPYILKREN